MVYAYKRMCGNGLQSSNLFGRGQVYPRYRFHYYWMLSLSGRTNGGHGGIQLALEKLEVGSRIAQKA